MRIYIFFFKYGKNWTGESVQQQINLVWPYHCKNWPVCPPVCIIASIETYKMQSLSTCRRVLNEVVQKLKKYSKEGQKNFEDVVGKQLFYPIPCIHIIIATLCQYITINRTLWSWNGLSKNGREFLCSRLPSLVEQDSLQLQSWPGGEAISIGHTKIHNWMFRTYLCGVGKRT